MSISSVGVFEKQLENLAFASALGSGSSIG